MFAHSAVQSSVVGLKLDPLTHVHLDSLCFGSSFTPPPFHLPLLPSFSFFSTRRIIVSLISPPCVDAMVCECMICVCVQRLMHLMPVSVSVSASLHAAQQSRCPSTGSQADQCAFTAGVARCLSAHHPSQEPFQSSFVGASGVKTRAI